MKLSGWGRFPVVECSVARPRSEAEVLSAIARGSLIPRGNGRAYGDCAVLPDSTLDMRRLNRMLSFDEESGVLVAEAGTMLSDIVATFLPRGWFPYVTPGTKFVTLGGMVAADVHGKNHHRDGSIGNYVDWIDVACADGVVRRCSRQERRDLFEWTLGGMGLTGIILRAAMRLRRVETAWIEQTLLPAPDLDSAMEIFERSRDETYSVAWVDCLATERQMGRSVIMLGNHALAADLPPALRAAPLATPAKRSLSVPVNFPEMLLSSLSVKAFNHLYYWNAKRRSGTSYVDCDSYFYPLDAILNWNRIYGRRGFAQYQCALPLETSRSGLLELLGAIASSGSSGSFLAVLKQLGPEGPGISFARPGYTLALDFPISKANLDLMERLDRITAANGGRLYLAKDSRMAARTLEQTDPRTKDFRAMRQSRTMDVHFRSAQSERLGL